MKIHLIAFNGTGGFDRNLGRLPALVIAGHVGFQFEDDPNIYGFHPTPEAVKAAGSEKEIVALLKNHIPQPGCIQIDNEIFVRANEESEKGERTEVLYLTYEFDDSEFQRIKTTVQEWYNIKKEFWYNFPTYGGGFFQDQYNCSTFPMLLGIPVPCDTGYIYELIAVMLKEKARKWEP